MRLTSYLSEGVAAVREAGKLLKAYHYDMPTPSLKADNSPVTEADQRLEKQIRDRLLTAFPDSGFIGEEYPTTKPGQKLVWVCDPIDGTWSFLNKELTVSISLGLLVDGVPVLGIVYNPVTDELYSSAEGEPPLLNGKPIPLISKSSLYRSIVNLQLSPNTAEVAKPLYDLWGEGLFAKLVSQGGSVAYGLAKVAEGIHDVYIGWTRKTTNIWDVAPGIYLIESVGGKVSNVFGEPFGLDRIEGIVASANPAIHAEAIAMIESAGLFLSESVEL